LPNELYGSIDIKEYYHLAELEVKFTLRSRILKIFYSVNTKTKEQKKTEEMKISVFKNFNVIKENLEIQEILEQIKIGKYKTSIEILRSLIKQGKTDEYNERKRALPAFTPSGLFVGGRRLEFLKEYSGYIVLDIDKANENELENTKDKIAKIKYTYACFIAGCLDPEN